jgi:ABC-type polysaccharide/polyol phosphate transport system ATPase subunit
MSEAAIIVEGLSKRYLVGHSSENRGYKRYTALRDVIGREARNIARKTTDMIRGRQVVQGDEIEEFWALKHVSFEVNEGEVVGIIGRNGAGKSTLLKILSRITDPTEGRVRLRGRVGSLLEVGTGFHPELTGRENIFLNGAILGMTRREISKKFDEIVSFAGVEKFLDTPVKHFSSGMYVRLAFAVAAHLEPEILVVDEVLAVGDTEFQRKCLGKMDEVSRKEGRTVLFVSHNLAAVAEMADRALLLEAGSVVADSTVSETISTYLSKGSRDASYICPFAPRGIAPHIARVEVLTSERNGVQLFGKPLEVEFWIDHLHPLLRAYLSFQIVNQFQQPIVHAFDPELMSGSHSESSYLRCRFPKLRLNVGQFYLRVYLSGPPDAEIYETLDGICHFEVVRSDRNIPWGWRPEACAYHEQYTWTVADARAKLES